MFADRVDAGRQLAAKMGAYRGNSNVVLLALPRGGVVVAAEIARELDLALDIVVPRKIGAPGNPEYAIGAITEDGESLFDERAIAALGISPEYIAQTVYEEQREAERRMNVYRGGRPPLNVTHKTAILVDDGVATGATMRVAIRSVRKRGAATIIVAVPVIALDTLEILRREADEVISVDAPLLFGAVGAFYESFPQTSDEEVMKILEMSKA
ncbi:MAG: phosphoribosyltransferase [Candidatus Kerfeldbacteria bacterium]|nr:phosphoribosyltransferase [Candidatus Kerfeldbacteria bacterium]